MVRRAFTLIEILVVVTILMVIAGLTLAAAGPLQRSTKVARTKAILGLVRQGLALRATEQGSSLAPVAHPVAGGTTPRLTFQRRGAAGFTDGTAVATTGEALVAAVPAQVAASARDRLLLPEDAFADTGWPALYGLPRGQLRRLGIAPGFDRHRRLPDATTDPRHDQDGDGIVDPPYDATRYADARFLVGAPALAAGQDWAATATNVLSTALGGTTLDDLRGLGAVREGSGSVTALGGSVVVGPFADGEEGLPARLSTSDGSSGSRTWRHQGLNLVDAWNGEILAWTNSDHGLVLASAGPDRVFCWQAGEDGSLATPAIARPGEDAPSGDDHRGYVDNLIDGTP